LQDALASTGMPEPERAPILASIAGRLMASPMLRRPNQNWEAFVQYFTKEQWARMMQNPEIALDELTTSLSEFGLIHPSGKNTA
jgi:hypothetical protein